MGAARPRFQGAALREDGSMVRDSFASSTFNTGGSVNSSVYALNPAGATGGGNRSSSYLAAYRDDPNADYGDEEPTAPAAGYSDAPKPNYLEKKRGEYMSPSLKSKKKWGLIGGGILLLVIIAVAVAVPVSMNKSKNDSSSGATSGSGSTSGDGDSGSGNPSSRSVITGGDGSTVTMDDGSTFTYSNSFGGTWYYDPQDPFNNAARAQSWSPALNETFNYGSDIIRG